MNTNHAWYIKHNGNVEGPFPAGQIKQELLLGRYKLDEEVSRDKETWKQIRTIRDLIPEVLLTDKEDPDRNERIAAAKRWADERRSDRRGEAREEDKGERRDSESYESTEYRFNRETTMRAIQKRRNSQWLALVILILVLGGVAYIGFNYTSAPETSVANCEAPAAPQVNWSHCRMAGLQKLNQDFSNAIMQSTDLSGANFYASNFTNTQLDYADLGGAHLRLVDFAQATLKGVSLSNADLTQANLANTDLSYANLTGANIEKTDFTNAKLDNAIWVDGKKCQVGSVGRCR